MWYRFNIDRFVEQMLPPWFRSDVIKAIIGVLLAPLKWILEQFGNYKSQTEDRLNINGHVLPLEMALNKACFTDGIWLESVNERKSTYLYHESEGQTPPHLYKEEEDGAPLYIYYEGEAPTDANIKVHIPRTICTSLTSKSEDVFEWEYLNRIRSIMTRYKPAGRTFMFMLYP